MLTTFVLSTIAQALEQATKHQDSHLLPVYLSRQRLSGSIQRFGSLWKVWVKSHRIHRRCRQHPELDRLYARTAKVMTEMAIVISDISMELARGEQPKVQCNRLVHVLRSARKAIRSGQKITHLEESQTWMLPDMPTSWSPASEAARQEYERRQRLNENAHALIERRRQPLQCCMFVALVSYQYLHHDELHEFVAEYEDEVVKDTFDRTLSVDDAKTYEQLQLKNHSRARLTPPQNKIPKTELAYDEYTCTPRYVRNPMTCGMEVVSNQIYLEDNGKDYINLNRNNSPQHIV